MLTVSSSRCLGSSCVSTPVSRQMSLSRNKCLDSITGCNGADLNFSRDNSASVDPSCCRWYWCGVVFVPSTRDVKRVMVAALRRPAGRVTPILSSLSLSARPPFLDLALQHTAQSQLYRPNYHRNDTRKWNKNEAKTINKTTNKTVNTNLKKNNKNKQTNNSKWKQKAATAHIYKNYYINLKKTLWHERYCWNCVRH